MLKFKKNIFGKKLNNSYKSYENSSLELKDYGPDPFTINLQRAAEQNNTYRTALWTGDHLQLTLMSINPGEDVGLELHPDTDQFFMLAEGKGYVVMGPEKNNLNYKKTVYKNYAFIIPAGTWHNFVNTGSKPAKLFSIYAPPNHPFGTVHNTKEDAQAQEPEYSSNSKRK